MGTPQEKIEAALNGPAMRAPTGANFDPTLPGRSDEQVSFFVTVSVCVSVAGLFMILRYYSKITRRQKFKPADYLLILGFLGNIGLVVTGRIAVNYGAGVHQYNLKLSTLFKLLYYINIHQILYGPTIFSIKAAIILQYMSIFAPKGHTFNRFMFYGGWTTLIANLLFYLIRTIVTCVYCIPREKIWNKLLPGGTCIRQDWFIISSGFINAISDIIILMLPVASVWALQIPLKKKIQICLLFATGLLACLASCLRIYYGWKTTAGTEGQIDSSYYMAYEGLWAYAELALGIIVACSLSIPKLLKESSIISSTFSRFRVLLSQALGHSTSQIQLVDSDVYQLQKTHNRGATYENDHISIIAKDSDAESQRHLGQRIHVAVDIEQSTETVGKI